MFHRKSRRSKNAVEAGPSNEAVLPGQAIVYCDAVFFGEDDYGGHYSRTEGRTTFIPDKTMEQKESVLMLAEE